MPAEVNIESIRGRLPVRYRFNPFVRMFMIAITLGIGIYSIYFLAIYVNQDTPLIAKLIPIMILFVSLNSFIRHTTSLNSVIFTPECLWLRFILKPSIPIEYDKIESLTLQRNLAYYLYIGYWDAKDRKRIYKTSAAFPKMLEIMYNIVEMSPQIVLDEHLGKVMGYLKETNTPAEEVGKQ